MEYVESLSPTTLAEYKALNIISPYTPDAQAYREGLIATMMYNKGCSKKSQTKTLYELFPYLDTETPDWLEDEKVIKAKRILKAISLQKDCPDLYKASMDEFKEKIQEEIDILSQSDNPDNYTIGRLTKLIGGSDNGEDL